jgi:hypothetical protein
MTTYVMLKTDILKIIRSRMPAKGDGINPK